MARAWGSAGAWAAEARLADQEAKEREAATYKAPGAQKEEAFPSLGDSLSSKPSKKKNKGVTVSLSGGYEEDRGRGGRLSNRDMPSRADELLGQSYQNMPELLRDEEEEILWIAERGAQSSWLRGRSYQNMPELFRDGDEEGQNRQMALAAYAECPEPQRTRTPHVDWRQQSDKPQFGTSSVKLRQFGIIQEPNVEEQPQEQERTKDHVRKEDQVSTAKYRHMKLVKKGKGGMEVMKPVKRRRGMELLEEAMDSSERIERQRLVFQVWLKVCFQVLAGFLVSSWLTYTLWEYRYIPIELSMVMLRLIQSIGLYISFQGFLFFVITWPFWIPVPSTQKVKVIWKYKFWQFLGIIFKPNYSKLLKFADFVRKIFPHLAPCNALQDNVSWSAIASKYVARTDGGKIPGLPNLFQNPIVALNCHSEETFSSKVFQIGAGCVHVIKLTKDQFHFKCEARGKDFLEDFVAITNWKSIAIVLSILEFWETSPEVGIIENSIHQRKGIYCHALSMKEIVEGIDKSLDYFSIFQLQEAKQFFVGCGIGGESVSHDKENGSSEPHMTTSTIVAVMVAVGAFYQLRDNSNVVAILSLVILNILAMLIFVTDFFGHLLKKSCFYGICTALCLGSANGRLGIYLWLKKRNSTLAYCNEFRPDQLQVVDTTKEAIFLFKSQYITSENIWATLEEPDWASLHIDINALGTSDVWHNQRIGNNDVNFKLYTDPNNQAIVFKMVYLHSNCMIECGRTVLARSTCDRTQRGGLKGTMTTEVSLDGQAETYQWPVGSFHLFVYLMLKWRGLSDGVIENWEHFMLRTYYHVFSTHGLAAHIEKHKLVSHYLLPGHPQPTIP